MAKKKYDWRQNYSKTDDFFQTRRRLIYLREKLKKLNRCVRNVNSSRGFDSNSLYQLEKGLKHNTGEEENVRRELVQIVLDKLFERPVDVLDTEVKMKNNNLHIYIGDGWRRHGHIVIDQNFSRLVYFRGIGELHGRHNRCNIKLTKLFGCH